MWETPLGTKGALLYGVFPVCALRETGPQNLNVLGASLRSEQGPALPCAAMRLSLQTWSAETVLQTVPADQVFIS